MSNFYGDLATTISDDESEFSSEENPLQNKVEKPRMFKFNDDDFDSDHVVTSAQKAPNKRQMKSVLKSTVNENTDKHKPHVSFDAKPVEFDEADPLGDLLSDEEYLLGGKSKPKPTNQGSFDRGDSVTKSPAKHNKAKVIELFGLGDHDVSEPDKSSAADKSDWLGLKSEEKSDVLVQSNSKTSDWPSLKSAEKSIRSDSKTSDWPGLKSEEKSIRSDSKTSDWPGLKSEEKSIRTDSKTSDWLGLKSDEKSIQSDSKTSDWLGLKSEVTSKVVAPVKTSRRPEVIQTKERKQSITFDDNVDILSGMGFDEGDKSGQNVSGRTSRRTLPADRNLGQDSRDRKTNEPLTSNLSKLPAAKANEEFSLGGYAPSISVNPRRNIQRNKTGIVDPLGLFSATPSIAPSAVLHSSKPEKPNLAVDNAAMKSPRREPNRSSVLPTWLGGTATVPDEHTEKAEVPDEQGSGNRDVVDSAGALVRSGEGNAGSSDAVKVMERNNVDSKHNERKLVPNVATSVSDQLAAGAAFEQHTVLVLERQEHQLLTALQLKRHEECLTALQRQQAATLARQEGQLQTLVAHQTDRHRRVEQQMEAQQQRIDAHIHALMAQPIDLLSGAGETLGSATLDQVVGVAHERTEAGERNVEVQHDQRLALLEESYNQRVTALEASMADQKLRLQAECDSVETGYQARLARLEDELTATNTHHREKVAALQADHAADLTRLKEAHRDAVADLRACQAAVLDHMTKSLASTSSRTHQDNASAAILERLARDTRDVAQAQAHQEDTLADLRGSEVKARQVQLDACQEQLSRQREWSERERDKLLALVTSLEQQLNDQRHAVEEERWNARQDATRLDAKLHEMERERTRNADNAMRERNEVQALRQAAMLEVTERAERLEQERRELEAEKVRLATLSRIHGDPRGGNSVQVEAALSAARQALADLTEQREAVSEEQEALSRERYRLERLERELTWKARDLENMTQLAVATREEGITALEEARQRDREQVQRAAALQCQMEEVRERERKCGEERMLVSQERLKLRTGDEKLCNFCRSTFNPWDKPRSTSDKMIVDPKLVLQKLKAERDYSFNDSHHRLDSTMSASK